MKVDNLLLDIEEFLGAVRSLNSGIDSSCEVFNMPDIHAKCWRMEIPNSDTKNCSGVYFICSIEGEVLYIGKASANNLFREIVSKFGTPRVIEGDVSSVLFEKSLMAIDAPEDLRGVLLEGRFRIVVAVIEPGVLASLIEVYLQTRCAIFEVLPRLNRRIG